MKARIEEVLGRIDNNSTQFQYFNANPNGNNTNDCVIRSICAATGMEWDDVLSGLTKCALKHKLMVDDPDLYSKYLKEIGWEKQKQPKKSGGKKYKGNEWVKVFKGNAIAHIGTHHMVYVSHGKVWDTWDSTEGVIGNYWVKK